MGPRPWFALCLAACTGPVPVGDLDLVVVGSASVFIEEGTAAVDQLVLGPCTGDIQTVWVGYRMNLLVPEPLPVPVDEYCDVGLEFATDPFDGSLHLAGTTAMGTAFRLALDPGLATRQREFGYTVDTESLLVLDLALLLDPADVDAIDAMDEPVDIGPDDPLAEALADRVGDALVFYETPDQARGVYLDLWPDFDLSIDADVHVNGCTVDGPLIYEPPDDPAGEPVDRPGSDGPDPDPSRSGGCDGDGGCDGGGCSGSGCGDAGAGCDCGAACATGGFVPVWWLALVGFVVLRRRREGP